MVTGSIPVFSVNKFLKMLLNYLNIFIFLLFSLFLSFLLFNLSFIIVKQKKDLEKLTAYECGFNPHNDARKIFDIKF